MGSKKYILQVQVRKTTADSNSDIQQGIKSRKEKSIQDKFKWKEQNLKRYVSKYI